ncbi:MAG: menaquinone biosynthesis protein [Bacteroidota bacterium]
MVRISAVSYLNTKPFIYGLAHFLDKGSYSLELDIPSVCADKLAAGRADLGLVPVAVIPALDRSRIVSDYCIGADGAVGSVMLYSDTPLAGIERVLLDYQSRTSVLLVQVLAKHYWNIHPQWAPAAAGFEDQISGTTAGVVIGDRTFALAGKYAFAYDLSDEWKRFSGLPFVFACWVAVKELEEGFVRAFNHALGQGIARREQVIEELEKSGLTPGLLRDYLLNKVSYELDEHKKAGMKRFLELAAAV